MPPADAGGHQDERDGDDAPAGRFQVTWQLTVEHEDPATLVAALAPESQGHHDLDVDDGRLLAEGRGRVGESLHSLDDLLACLTAALDSLEIAEKRREG